MPRFSAAMLLACLILTGCGMVLPGPEPVKTTSVPVPTTAYDPRRPALTTIPTDVTTTSLAPTTSAVPPTTADLEFAWCQPLKAFFTEGKAALDAQTADAVRFGLTAADAALEPVANDQTAGEVQASAQAVRDQLQGVLLGAAQATDANAVLTAAVAALTRDPGPIALLRDAGLYTCKIADLGPAGPLDLTESIANTLDPPAEN